MKDTASQELLASVRQAGAIRRGTRRPARTTTFQPTDGTGEARRLAGRVRPDDRGERRHPSELGAGPAYAGGASAGAAPRRGS